MPGGVFDSVWVPTLVGAFLTAYEGEVDKSWGDPLMKKVTDVGEFVKLIDMGTVGSVRKFSGPRQTTRPRVYPITQTNYPFELSFAIPIEDVNRDKLGMWESKAAEIGAKFADHPTKMLIGSTADGSGLLGNPNCFDGTAFFGTHANSGHTIVNDISSTQVPALAAATAAAPTAVEMSNIITQLLGYFFTFLDEAGDPINGSARNFVFATSNPTVHGAILAAITSMQLSQGQTNPLLAGWAPKGYKFDARLDSRLGTSTSVIFYFFRADSIITPFIWAEEQALEMSYLGEGSDRAFDDNEYAWGGKAVRSVGPGRYQHAIRATLS